MLQRPKVLYNTNTHQYVMNMRLDDDLDYHYAHVAVAACDTLDGSLFLPQPCSWTINVGSGVATDALSTLEDTFLKLDGTIIGTLGSYLNLGNTIGNVFDGDLATFSNGPESSGGSNCWGGLDLGEGNARSMGALFLNLIKRICFIYKYQRGRVAQAG